MQYPGEPASSIKMLQIEKQIETLNEHFRNAADSAFPAVNTGIQFCLARVDSFQTIWSKHKLGDGKRLMDFSYQSPDNYLNIYVVKSISRSNPNDTSAKGYSTLPGFWLDYEMIVMDYKFFGDFAKTGSPLSSISSGVSLVHEVGHYLGLLHPFGCHGLNANNCATEGDLCCDVPGSSQNPVCSSSIENSCFEAYGDKPDLKENYMDYGPQHCKSVFTPDQTNIMYTTLTSYRRDLVSPSNVNALNLNCCKFSLHHEGGNQICKNDSTRYTAIKYESGTIYTWRLYKKGILVWTSTDTTHTRFIVPPDTGRYDLKLVIIAGSFKDSVIRTDYINTLNCTGLESPQANWYFGEHAGVKFTTTGPIRDIGPYLNPLNIYQWGAPTAVSSAKGKLLFYAGVLDRSSHERITVFKSDYRPMSHSTHKPRGNTFSSQSAIAMPFANDSNKYYLSTISSPLQSDNSDSVYFKGCYYSVVDILNNIVYFDSTQLLKDSLGVRILSSGTSLSAVPKCDDKSYWLIFLGKTVNTSNQPRFFIYSVDSTGYHFYKTQKAPKALWGQIKFSPDGNWLSYATYLYLFDRFDATLQLKHTDTIPGTNYYIIGTCFSPDSKLFYRYEQRIKAFEQNFMVTQSQVYSSSVTKNKATVFDKIQARGNVQAAPDSNIYVTQSEENYLTVIKNPNWIVGTNSKLEFKQDAVPLTENGIGGGCFEGLPNFIDALPISKITPDINFEITNCTNVKYYPNQCCASSFTWVFGDGDTSFSKQASHTYTDTGKYLVKLILPGNVITKWIQIGIGNQKAKIFGDTILCDTMTAYEYSTKLYENTTYSWTQNSAKSFVALDQRAWGIWRNSSTLQLKLTNTFTGCYDSIKVGIHFSVIPNNLSIGSKLIICDSTHSTPISGLAPTNLSGGTFTYRWHYILPDSTWRQVDSAIYKNFNPHKIPFATQIIREVNQTGCRAYSNRMNLFILSHTNKIQLTQSPCFKGSSFSIEGDTTYSSLDTYIQWQISTNGTDWNYYDVHSKDLDTLLEHDSIYIRRLVNYTTYSCEFASNVIKIVPDIAIISQPKPNYVCSFSPFTFKIKVRNLKSFPLLYWWRHKDSSSNSWSLHLGTDSVTDNAVYSTSTDSFQFVIQAPCGYMYSNKVLLKVRKTGPEIDTHPFNQDLNEGERANLVGEVFNPYEAGLSYRWQYRKNMKSYNSIPASWTYKAPSWLYVEDSVRNKLQFIASICDDSTEYRFIANNGCNSYSNSARLFMTNMADLWMHDSERDRGAEPNRFVAGRSNPSQRTFDIFKSPDVFNCTDSPGCISPENAEFKNNGDNYVRFKIHNRGLQTSKPARLYLYWTLASTGELWDRHWKSTSEVSWYQNGNWTFPHHNHFNNIDSGQYFPTGGQINATGILIQPLDTGETFDSSFAWRPPNPRWYHTTVDGVRQTQTRLQICLLARIEYCDQYPHEMEFNELYRVSVDTNVVNNNNIATHNLWVSDEVPLNIPWNNRQPRNTWTRVHQPREVLGPITLHFDGMDSVYNPSVRVIITMDDSLHQAWVNGGLVGTGFISLGSQRYQLTSSNATFGNIYSDSTQVGNIGVEFLPLDTAALPTDTFYYTLSQTFDEDGSYEGGVVFRVDFNTVTIEEEDGDEEPNIASIKEQQDFRKKQNSYLVYPNPANTRLTIYISAERKSNHAIQITDLTGKILITDTCQIKKAEGCTKLIDISHLAVGTYFIRLSSDINTEVRKINILR